MEMDANDNLDGFMKKAKYFLQPKTVQAINTVQCTGIYHISKWQALCSLTGQLSTLCWPALCSLTSQLRAIYSLTGQLSTVLSCKVQICNNL
jgi:hypothetical protein